MTVHAAKGLEFPYVFLCGMNEGVFPSRKIRSRAAMEEERRLAFVALTRAKRGLFLSEADGRNFDGSPRYPSRFLLDIDPGLLTFVDPPAEELLEETRRYIEASLRSLPDDEGALSLPVGQRVRHFLFGEGVVLGEDRDKGAHLIQFEGMDTPRLISMKVKLERL